MIVAIGSRSPTHEITKRDIKYGLKVNFDGKEVKCDVVVDWRKRLPDLCHWSDVVGSLWHHQARREGRSPNELKYVLRCHITTEEMREMLKMVARRRGQLEPDDDSWRPSAWEEAKNRDTVAKESEEFYAFLNTPHGRGVLFFVQQYLDDKEIIKITPFSTQHRNSHHYYWHMLFELGDKPQRQSKDPSTSSKPTGPIKGRRSPPLTGEAARKKRHH